jgi:thiol-disulfide isomerase/thioredoxin
MFLWWSDPYTWITAAALLFTVALALRFLDRVLRKSAPRPWITWALTLLWVLSVCPWLYITARTQNVFGQEQNSPAPNILLTLEDGRQVHLADLRGNVVLLDFWATWCGPCRASEPALHELSGNNARRGLVIARISGDENVNAWRKYLRAHPSNALEALDQDSSSATALGVEGRPTFVLIDKEGVIRWRQRGWTPYSYLMLRHALMRLLA